MSNRTRPIFHLLAFVAWLACPSLSRAQHVGFTLARTNSDIRTSYGDGMGNSFPDRDAFAAGLTYRHHLRSRLVLQPELLWVAKGYGDDSKPTHTLSYIEMPVLLRIGALGQKGFPLSPVFSLGPTVSVLATCRVENLPSTTKSEQCSKPLTTPLAVDYRTHRLDAGMMFGLGLEGRTRDGSIFAIEGRYEYGLRDIGPQAGTSRNTTTFVMLHVVPSRLY